MIIPALHYLIFQSMLTDKPLQKTYTELVKAKHSCTKSERAD
jgi:hypothetical protein